MRRARHGVIAYRIVSLVVSFLSDGSSSPLLSLSFFYEEDHTMVCYRFQQSILQKDCALDQRLITYHLYHSFVLLPLHDSLNVFVAANKWKHVQTYSDADFLLAHSQYHLRMRSFPCIKNGRQKSGFIIAGSSENHWFQELNCDNQEWFHVEVTEHDVVEEERRPPRLRMEERQDGNSSHTALRRFLLDLPRCLANLIQRNVILFLDYRIIQSFMCSSLCPCPHIQIASCLLTSQEKGAITVLNGFWVVLEFSLHGVPPVQALQPENAVVYVIEERRVKRWVKRNAEDVDLAKKWVTESLEHRYHAIKRRYNGNALGKPVAYCTQPKELITNPVTGDVLFCNL